MSITESTTIAKLHAMQHIVIHLQIYREDQKDEGFDAVRSQIGLFPSAAMRNAVQEYLTNETAKSCLRRIAFPLANHADVQTALMAGSTLHALCALARGNPFYADGVAVYPHLLRDDSGQPVKAKHGLKIIWREADLPKKLRNQIVEKYRRASGKPLVLVHG